MKHAWSILCQRSIIDQRSNNISLIDVLEQLNINVSPEQVAKESEEGIVIPINFDIVSLWTKDGEENKVANFEVVVEFDDPRGKELKSFTKSIEVAQNYQRMRTQMRIERLQIFESGIHMVRVSIKEGKQEKKTQIVAELPLQIKFVLSIKETKNAKSG